VSETNNWIRCIHIKPSKVGEFTWRFLGFGKCLVVGRLSSERLQNLPIFSLCCHRHAIETWFNDTATEHLHSRNAVGTENMGVSCLPTCEVSL